MVKVILVIFLIFSPCVLAENGCVEEIYLREKFPLQVGGVSLTDDYKGVVFSQLGAALDSNGEIISPQYILFVDRNPSVQLATLLFVNPLNGYFVIIGADKVSTGNPARRGYFITPLGFVENSPVNMSYRALGTKNSKGWKGLGTKGRRVWDFGWVETRTAKREPYQIRLLLHATDPDNGEPRLGKVDSKGCIRISGEFNRFLDYFGVLDAEYEYNDKVRYVLLKEREPVCNPGKLVLVGDSTGAF